MYLFSITSNASYFLGVNFKEIKRVRVSCRACVKFIGTRSRDVNYCRRATFTTLPTFLTSVFSNVIWSNVVRINNSAFISGRFNSFFNATATAGMSSDTSLRPLGGVWWFNHFIVCLTCGVNGVLSLRTRPRGIFFLGLRPTLSIFCCFQYNYNDRYRCNCSKRWFTCVNCFRVNEPRIVSPLKSTVTFICHGRTSLRNARFLFRSIHIRSFQ